jgi:hypothetical protein
MRRPVGFLRLFPDQPHLACLRHDHFVSQLTQQAAHPGRVHAGFQRDATVRYSAEHFLQAVVLSRCSRRMVPVSSSTQYQLVRSPKSNPMVNFLLRDFPARVRRSGATLLHCRSPFYLCFEHVDNLGAYTASRPETGLLIPSGYID